MLKAKNIKYMIFNFIQYSLSILVFFLLLIPMDAHCKSSYKCALDESKSCELETYLPHCKFTSKRREPFQPTGATYSFTSPKEYKSPNILIILPSQADQFIRSITFTISMSDQIIVNHKLEAGYKVLVRNDTLQVFNEKGSVVHKMSDLFCTIEEGENEIILDYEREFLDKPGPEIIVYFHDAGLSNLVKTSKIYEASPPSDHN